MKPDRKFAHLSLASGPNHAPGIAHETEWHVEEISPRDLCKRHEAGELWQFLDVRELWELELARVAGAIHIPMAEIAARLDELDRERPVAVLCHSGVRSAGVAAYLHRHGFGPVANVTGGIDAWARQIDESIPRY